jgi:carbamoyl-phosphate synthase/aspartate carbamoyltransferase/dihydroorotase
MTRLRLPGLIDPHVHLRDPGAVHKEDWASGTAAALAGGITCVLDMPNNTPPTTTEAALAGKEAAAASRARCDYGIHFGAGGDNAAEAARLAPRCTGLKLYLDATFGPLHLGDLAPLQQHFANWPRERPILAHAEGRTVAAVLFMADLYDRSVHICHVSRREEIELIAAARAHGTRVTCEVCPHHMFLTRDNHNLPPGYVEVRPRLAGQEDVDALWAHLSIIDCFATDHAPHTRAEKDSASPPPGYPGLETALPLWLTAVDDGRLTLAGITARMSTNPAHIFDLPIQPDTWVEVDPDHKWTITAGAGQSRCGWTPFEGWHVRGKVTAVTLRGQLAYDGESVLALPGTGLNVRNTSQ